MGSLTSLEGLQLHDNQLAGEIPAELGSLTNLKDLGLHYNYLTGGILAELGDLTSLTVLYLHGNQLTGGIPEELGSLTSLEGLYLFSNQLTGEIPAELGDLTNLVWLGLNDNQLTGEIPAELGDLSRLWRLYLSSNQLTGCIPSGLRNIQDNDLGQLGLPFCDMPGAPTIATPIVPGDASLTVAWAAPINTGSSAITAYDLRYIETGAADKSDANWTVVEDVWAAGSGSLQYTLSGLTGGTQYDVQVRAVNAAGANGLDGCGGSWEGAGSSVLDRTHRHRRRPDYGLQDRRLGRRQQPMDGGVHHDRRCHRLHRRGRRQQWSHVRGWDDAALSGFSHQLRRDGPAFQRGRHRGPG